MSPEQLHLLAWLVFAIFGMLVGFALGKLRAQPGAGTLLGATLGPIGWLLIFTLADKRPRCSECRGIVIDGATRCRHCGGQLGHLAR